MRKKRYNYTPEEKVLILTSAILSTVYQYRICVTNINFSRKYFTSGRSCFFENGATAFGRNERNRKRTEEARIQQLEDKLRRKHEVLSELMEEHVKLKKELGEL
jgi:hypothetical protein